MDVLTMQGETNDNVCACVRPNTHDAQRPAEDASVLRLLLIPANDNLMNRERTKGGKKRGGNQGMNNGARKASYTFSQGREREREKRKWILSSRMI